MFAPVCFLSCDLPPSPVLPPSPLLLSEILHTSRHLLSYPLPPLPLAPCAYRRSRNATLGCKTVLFQSWADASQRAGLPYYPKLLVGVPFTPAAGARVLIDPSLDERTRGLVRKTVAMFLR